MPGQTTPSGQCSLFQPFAWQGEYSLGWMAKGSFDSSLWVSIGPRCPSVPGQVDFQSVSMCCKLGLWVPQSQQLLQAVQRGMFLGLGCQMLTTWGSSALLVKSIMHLAMFRLCWSLLFGVSTVLSRAILEPSSCICLPPSWILLPLLLWSYRTRHEAYCSKSWFKYCAKFYTEVCSCVHFLGSLVSVGCMIL